jgi:competence ComEA-like helix-hairpin-helix protein
VTLYTRHQLALLFTLLAAGGVGLAVREWRAAYPELAERLERFDRGQAERGGGGARGSRAPLAAEAPPPPRPNAPGRPPEHEASVANTVREHQHREAKAWVGVPPPVDREPRLDLNAATVEDLKRLPGVGPVLAARILETRHRQGRFGGLDDLRQVKGLNRDKFERLRPLVTLGE